VSRDLCIYLFCTILGKTLLLAETPLFLIVCSLNGLLRDFTYP